MSHPPICSQGQLGAVATGLECGTTEREREGQERGTNVINVVIKSSALGDREIYSVFFLSLGWCPYLLYLHLDMISHPSIVSLSMHLSR